MKASNGTKAILITSCEEDTGKTSIVTNFAISLARSGKSVIILDCDLRKATISKLFNDSSQSPGLISILTNNTNPSDVIKSVKIDKKSDKVINYILTGGSTENSGEVLQSENLKYLIDELSTSYDYILIDTPPITKIVDTLVLGKFVKDLILVLRLNHTYKESVAMAIEELEQSKVNILGFIVNALDLKKLPNRYKYGYSYGYY